MHDYLAATCGWDGNWDFPGATMAGNCLSQRCDKIPAPPPENNLRLVEFDGEPINVDQVRRCVIIPTAFLSRFIRVFPVLAVRLRARHEVGLGSIQPV